MSTNSLGKVAEVVIRNNGLEEDICSFVHSCEEEVSAQELFDRVKTAINQMLEVAPEEMREKNETVKRITEFVANLKFEDFTSDVISNFRIQIAKRIDESFAFAAFTLSRKPSGDATIVPVDTVRTQLHDRDPEMVELAKILYGVVAEKIVDYFADELKTAAMLEMAKHAGPGGFIIGIYRN